MERSSELKKILTESISEDGILDAAVEESSRYSWINRDNEILSRLDSEMEHIAEYEKKYADFFQRFQDMTEEEFASAYQSASEDFNSIANKIRERYTFTHLREGSTRRSDTLDFSELSSIETLEQYVEKFPMQFVPTKEEIARILSIATTMHESRISRGQAQAQEPIRILDIGGSNGTLGKLITDLAKANDLAISYMVVDPDTPTIEAAAQHYQHDDVLTFREDTGEHFNRERETDSQITELINTRQKLIVEGDKKVADLQVLMDTISKKHKESKLSLDAMEIYSRVLKNDFNIECPSNVQDDPEAFIEYLYSFKNDYSFEDPVVFYLRKQLRQRVDQITLQIEQKLAKRSPEYDLVINSWMPIGMDLTRSIREANGAAILYALERGGATGTRTDAPYPEYPQTLAYEDSYNPGSNYSSKVGWISHATPQLRNMLAKDHQYFAEDLDSWTPAFANGFLVQVRKDFENKKPEEYTSNPRVKATGEYPWDIELGPISPVGEIKDENGVAQILEGFWDIEERITPDKSATEHEFDDEFEKDEEVAIPQKKV